MLDGMTANTVVGSILIILSLVLVVAGALATAGKLPGNPVIGLRVASVRKDKSIWDQAHKVAGPFVLFAGVALAFGAAFAFIAAGWLWLAPVLMLVLAVAALSVAGNFGARAAALVDAAREAGEEGSAHTAATPLQESAAPAPQVNLDALRTAATRADNPENT